MTPEALRQAGLDALQRELGVVGMVRFLQQFGAYGGDYTAERWQWLRADEDVESLLIAAAQAGATVREVPKSD